MSIVVARDLDGVDDDLFLATSNIDPLRLRVTLSGDRWAIEQTFQDLKQYLATEDSQCWVGHDPERVVELVGWLYSTAWGWFLEHWDTRHTYWPECSRHPARQGYTTMVGERLIEECPLLWRGPERNPC